MCIQSILSPVTCRDFMAGFSASVYYVYLCGWQKYGSRHDCRQVKKFLLNNYYKKTMYNFNKNWRLSTRTVRLGRWSLGTDQGYFWLRSVWSGFIQQTTRMFLASTDIFIYLEEGCQNNVQISKHVWFGYHYLNGRKDVAYKLLHIAITGLFSGWDFAFFLPSSFLPPLAVHHLTRSSTVCMGAPSISSGNIEWH